MQKETTHKCVLNWPAAYAGVRKPLKYLAILIIVGYAVFGVFPQKGLPVDAESIVIEKFISGSGDAVGTIVLNREETLRLSKDIGYVWCNYLMYNSWEETPHYWLTVHSSDKKVEKLYVSSSEFAEGCKSSNELVGHLEKRLF
ncbi:hypothetical protein [Thalassotalea fusca]